MFVEPDAGAKFLAAEVLHGAGNLVNVAHGNSFCFFNKWEARLRDTRGVGEQASTRRFLIEGFLRRAHNLRVPSLENGWGCRSPVSR